MIKIYCAQKHLNLKFDIKNRTSEMAQQINVVPTVPDNLRAIPYARRRDTALRSCPLILTSMPLLDMTTLPPIKK